MQHVRLTIAIIGVSGCLSFNGRHAQAQLPSDHLHKNLTSRLNVAEFQIQPIEVERVELNQARIRIVLDGEQVHLNVAPHSLRAGDVKLLARGANGTLTPTQPPALETFRGHVEERAGGAAAITIRNGQIRGMIDDGQSTWWVQPLESVDPTADPRLHILMPNAALVPGDWTCGLDLLGIDAGHAHGGIAGPPPPSGPGCLKKAEIAFDADFEYFEIFNVPGALDPVADVMADIESIMNSVDFMYRRDCGITYEITTIIVQTVEPDPYTTNNAGGLLGEFGAHWQANHADIIRDVAHLMTGKDIDGGTIGIAWLPGVCTPDHAYGLSQSQFSSNIAWRVRVTAHELGHNWAAPHCNQGQATCLDTCSIMCSSVGGCVQTTHEFESCSADIIKAYRDSLTCLDSAGDVSLVATRFVPLEALPGDRFGSAVAMDGDVAIIGAYGTDPPADSGAAYILRFDPATLTWNQEAILKASDAGPNDRFGVAVDIVDYDGGEVAIISAMLDDDGGRDAGAAYIFRSDGTQWFFEQKLTASDKAPFDFFGRSVAIARSNQGEVAIVGAYLNDDDGTSSGSAYVFRANSGVWAQEQKLLADDAEAFDQLGFSVSIAAADGAEYAIVGAFMDDGTAMNEGSAYIFEGNGSSWGQVQKLISPHPLENDQFGQAVAITASSNVQTAVVAGWKTDVQMIPNAGEAYIYKRDLNGWSLEDQISAPEPQPEAHFGNSISLRGDALLIGAYFEDSPLLNAGAAYLFHRVGFGWVQQAKFTATMPAEAEQFGNSADLGSGDQLIIAAWADDGNGIDTGAVYITSGSEFIDCNRNKVPDTCDIASGTSLDVNKDGIPDECQKPPVSCPGDIAPIPSGNGLVDVDDLISLINAWGNCPAPPIPCFADIAPPGGNGVVDVDDLILLINGWGVCPK